MKKYTVVCKEKLKDPNIKGNFLSRIFQIDEIDEYYTKLKKLGLIKIISNKDFVEIPKIEKKVDLPEQTIEVPVKKEPKTLSDVEYGELTEVLNETNLKEVLKNVRFINNKRRLRILLEIETNGKNRKSVINLIEKKLEG